MAAETRSVAASEPAVSAPYGALGWPGMRTLQSARFRTILAGALWLVGELVLAAVLLRQAAMPNGQYAFDLQVYHQAAVDMAAGRSPYAPEMFSGPIPAQGALLYKYPPVLAQLLVPLAGLPVEIVAGAWFLTQACAVFLATWLALRAGGVQPTAEAFAWSAVATTFFLPAFDTLWKGNVSGFLALAVAVVLFGGAAGGLGGAVATLIKTTPAVMLLPALFAGRRVLTGLLAAVPIFVTSFVLAPAAWLDFGRLMPNLLSGPSFFNSNMAPHSLVYFALPSVPVAAELARVLAVVVGAVAAGLSVLAARRADGWPAAVTLSVAALLLLPSATWYHYLAVLLPVAAYAWGRASRRQRVSLFAGSAGISLGLAWFPLVVAGAALTVVTSLFAIWPRARAAT